VGHLLTNCLRGRTRDRDTRGPAAAAADAYKRRLIIVVVVGCRPEVVAARANG